MPTPESARMSQPNSSFRISISSLRFGRALFDLEARVDVFGVLAEDHHVDQLGVLHRRRHALEPAHRAQAHVEVEELAQRDVERADAAADRRGERALDPDEVLAERVDGLVGQPRAGRVERLLAGEHFLPRDRLAVLRGRRVHDELRRRPDVDTGAVAFDVRDDRLVGNDSTPSDHRDLVGHGRQATGSSADSGLARAEMGCDVGARRRHARRSRRCARAAVTRPSASWSASGRARPCRASASRPVDCTMISTRRFRARPAAVAFDAIGSRSPRPSGNSRASVEADRHEVLARPASARRSTGTRFDGYCTVAIGTLSV